MSANLSAIDLLKLGDQGRPKPFLNLYWPEILGVCFGLGTGITVNLGSRRPAFSGIYKHAIFVAAWTMGLKFLQEQRNDYFAEKDAVFRNYIELHPEDFPACGLERKKIGDILEPWIPIR